MVEDNNLDENSTPSIGTSKAHRSLAPDSVRRQAFDLDQNRFALPTVTVASASKRARDKRTQDRRRCTLAGCLRVLVLVFPLVYYKEISGFFLLMAPQTVISSSHIKIDYSSIKGIQDLCYDSVEPGCFRGVIDCPCQDPMVPVEGLESQWMDTHLLNQQLTQSEQAMNVDVVFYGDSITEAWRETKVGAKAEGSWRVFQSYFSKADGGKYNGLALGISGDTSPKLLWRIQNGELPENLNPAVYWILIGTNDIGRTWCSSEMVVIGALRNVEEILLQRPDAHVVINGLLPRTFNGDGYVAKGGAVKPSVWEDIKAINGELKLYAAYRDRVSYFETNVFLKDPSAKTNQLQIDRKLMPDFLHPSSRGYLLWGEEIVQKLDSLSIK